MSHMVRQMAYVGEVPWHGLGSALTPDASMETWATEAGLDYKVCRSRVRFGDGEHAKVWDERHVLFRSDTKEPLSIVSNRYQIVQPAEVLEFFRDLSAKNGFQLETAGTLYDGARYWALAKVPLDFSLPGNDKVGAYVLLATSCDGSIATTGMLTSVRVVCNNTLQGAMARDGKRAIKVRHSTEFQATRMQVDLGLVQGQWGEFERQARAMAGAKLGRREAAKLLIEAIGDPKKPAGDQPRNVGTIFDLFERRAIGREMESAAGTAWGLVNAASQFYDHEAGRSVNTRLASSWFGVAGEAKQAVYDTVLAHVSAGSSTLLDAAIAATA